MGEPVTIVEMAPRDGLQNEQRPIPTAEKVRLVDLLARTGLRRIEVTSFVSARWVPQLGDAAAVMAGIERRAGVRYSALTPNARGLAEALAARVDEAAVFASASEGFSRANLNCSIPESLERFRPVMAAAREAGLPVRGYVSCITDCPFDGPVAPAAVLNVARALLRAGCYEVSLGDTLGRATPNGISRLLDTLRAELPAAALAGHFHDTQGHALANVTVSLRYGLRTFDAAAGGLGGCPYAPGSKGNVATEALAAHLAAMGFDAGIDGAALAEAAAFARSLRSAA